MTAALYSTEDVAAALGLHVRTVRGYVRDGRLPAVRIGKQYRIAREDFEKLAGRRGVPTPPVRVEVSAIVTIDGVTAEVASRVSTHAMAAAGGRSGAQRLDVHTAYDEARQALKVIAVGDADDAARMITLCSALVQADVE